MAIHTGRDDVLSGSPSRYDNFTEYFKYRTFFPIIIAKVGAVGEMPSIGLIVAACRHAANPKHRIRIQETACSV